MKLFILAQGSLHNTSMCVDNSEYNLKHSTNIYGLYANYMYLLVYNPFGHLWPFFALFVVLLL